MWFASQTSEAVHVIYMLHQVYGLMPDCWACCVVGVILRFCFLASSFHHLTLQPNSLPQPLIHQTSHSPAQPANLPNASLLASQADVTQQQQPPVEPVTHTDEAFAGVSEITAPVNTINAEGKIPY